MELNYVIIKPLSTEKANFYKEKSHRYVFKVHPNANKIEIKQAVETLFNVNVERVTVVRKRPRLYKRNGRVIGTQSGFKKAYVTLAANEKIADLEGV